MVQRDCCIRPTFSIALDPSHDCQPCKLFAPVQVQEDIVSSLQLKNPRILISSFDRPNISYYVELLKEAEKPMPKMIRSLEAGKRDGSWPCAIIYTLKRESADDTAACLQTAGDIEFSRLLCTVVGFSYLFVYIPCKG